MSIGGDVLTQTNGHANDKKDIHTEAYYSITVRPMLYALIRSPQATPTSRVMHSLLQVLKVINRLDSHKKHATETKGSTYIFLDGREGLGQDSFITDRAASTNRFSLRIGTNSFRRPSFRTDLLDSPACLA